MAFAPLEYKLSDIFLKIVLYKASHESTDSPDVSLKPKPEEVDLKLYKGGEYLVITVADEVLKEPKPDVVTEEVNAKLCSEVDAFSKVPSFDPFYNKDKETKSAPAVKARKRKDSTQVKPVPTTEVKQEVNFCLLVLDSAESHRGMGFRVEAVRFRVVCVKIKLVVKNKLMLKSVKVACDASVKKLVVSQSHVLESSVGLNHG